MSVNWHTLILCFHKLRELIAEQINAETLKLLAGEIKEDESYFGAAEQQSAAVFGMVQAFLDAFEVAAQKCRSNLAPASAGQFRSQDAKQHTADGLQEFEQHIAGEAVTDHNVEGARKDIATFAIP